MKNGRNFEYIVDNGCSLLLDLIKMMNLAKYAVAALFFRSGHRSVDLPHNLRIVGDGLYERYSLGAYVDIVEEALNLFRGNVYFANFEIHGPADRLLVVLILYISRVCLFIRFGYKLVP